MKTHLCRPIVLLILILISSCTPQEKLAKTPLPKDSPFNAFGTQVEIWSGSHRNIPSRRISEGELIAINKDTIIINASGNLQKFSKDSISSVRFKICRVLNNRSGITTMAIISCILPISHGWVGIITLPLNLAVMIPSIVYVNSAIREFYYPKDISWEEVYKFARFPQGIPPQINYADIK